MSCDTAGSSDLVDSFGRVLIDQLSNHCGKTRPPWWRRDSKSFRYPPAIEHGVHWPTCRRGILIRCDRFNLRPRTRGPCTEPKGHQIEDLLRKSVPADAAGAGKMESAPFCFVCFDMPRNDDQR